MEAEKAESRDPFMKFCSRCGEEIRDEAMICSSCGCIVGPPMTPQKPEKDGSGGWLCVLAALIPPFGLIYWQVMYYKAPVRATECGMIAIISMPIYVAIAMLFISLFGK